MNSKYFKIVTFLISFAFLFSATYINIYAENLIQPDYGDADVADTESFEEYADEVMDLIKQEDTAVDYDEAEKNEFYTCRLVLQSDFMDRIDFSQYDCKKIIIDDSDKVAVLQFDDEETARQANETLNRNKWVNFSQPDMYSSVDDEFEMNPAYDSADDYPGMYSWGVGYMNADIFAEYLYDNGYDDTIVVGVIDSGVQLDHPFLKDRLVKGYDFVDDDSAPEDLYGHGTHVAGTIVDCTGDLNVMIMPIRVLNDKGKGTTTQVCLGMLHALKNNIRVINMSLGGDHDYLKDYYINQNYDAGNISIVTAGNSSTEIGTYCPAHCVNAVTVSAITSAGGFASFSNYGSAVDFTAPGKSIKSSYINSTYASMSGTSMAAPHIAASVAMIKLLYPDYSIDQIVNLMKEICFDLGTKGYDTKFGYGVPDFSILLEMRTPDIQLLSSESYIDDDFHQIVIWEQGINSVDDILETDCSYEVVENENGFGTGSQVKFYKNGELLQTYSLVVKGDVTGDGYVDVYDVSVLTAVVNFEIEFDVFSAFDMAGDLDEDLFIDSIDLAKVISISMFE